MEKIEYKDISLELERLKFNLVDYSAALPQIYQTMVRNDIKKIEQIKLLIKIKE